jgi:hypothetical protein
LAKLMMLILHDDYSAILRRSMRKKKESEGF